MAIGHCPPSDGSWDVVTGHRGEGEWLPGTPWPDPAQTPKEPPGDPKVFTQSTEATATGILLAAAKIVGGDRGVTHGDKERSFEMIGELWTIYLCGRGVGFDGPISARDVVQMMVLLKVARSVQGTAHPDHFLDEAGYAAIAGELAAKEKSGAR